MRDFRKFEDVSSDEEVRKKMFDKHKVRFKEGVGDINWDKIEKTAYKNVGLGDEKGKNANSSTKDDILKNFQDKKFEGEYSELIENYKDVFGE